MLDQGFHRLRIDHRAACRRDHLRPDSRIRYQPNKMKTKKELTHAEMSRKGGLATKKKMGGKDYFKAMAKKRWAVKSYVINGVKVRARSQNEAIQKANGK
jgi:hypothetical protein